MTYRIRNWDIHYENNRTRELKKMGWIPLPNDHDSDGYTQLVEYPNGAAYFGCWVALLKVASRCDPRGTLLRRCKKPHDSASLSRITRLDKRLYDDLLPILLDIEWIEDIEPFSAISHEGAGLSHDDAGISQDPALKGREGKGTERKRREGNSLSEKNSPTLIAFDEARQIFPGNKRGLQVEFDNFRKKDSLYRATVHKLKPAIERKIQWAAERKAMGYFFTPEWPNFKTWINQSRWEEELSINTPQQNERNTAGDETARLYHQSRGEEGEGENPPGTLPEDSSVGEAPPDPEPDNSHDGGVTGEAGENPNGGPVTSLQSSVPDQGEVGASY